MREFYATYQKQIVKYSILIGYVLFIFLFVKYLFAYTVPFVLGFVVSLILSPVADFLQSVVKRLSSGKIFLSRGIASITSILLLILVFSFLGTHIVTRAINQGKQLMLNAPEYLEQARVRVRELNEHYNDLYELIPVEFREITETTSDSFWTSVTEILASTIKDGTVNTVVVLPQILATLLLTLIASFFFVKDRDLIRETLQKRTPKFISNGMNSISRGMSSALIGYVRAQLTLMSITGVIAIVGLTVIGYPYSLFIGILIACVDALPILGSGFILWPWAFYSLILGNYTRAISLLAIYGVITISRQSFEPKILGKQIGVHPLLTLMSIYIGLNVFGILGFLIGPVILVSSKVILEGVGKH